MRGLFTAALAVATLLAGKVGANPATTWTQVAGPIQPPSIANSGNGATLGSAIALSKDKKTMLVAADNFPPVGQAFIYTRPTTKSAWQLTQTLLPDTTQFNALYGEAVAMSQNAKIMAVAAYNYLSGVGAVFVYKYDLRTKQWKLYGTRLDPTLTSTNPTPQFGTAIAFDAAGKTLFVTAPNFSTTGQTADGVVYVYKNDPKTQSFKLVQTFRPTSVSLTGAIFGAAISSSANGKIVAVGASGFNTFAGAVFTYVLNAKTGQYQLQTTLTPTTAVAPNMFGNEVHLSASGKTLAVIAFGFSTPQLGQGSLYTFAFKNGAWQVTAANLQPANRINDPGFAVFGQSLSISADGKTIAVGASSAVPGTQGSVYVFSNVKGTWKVANPITVTKTGTSLGFSLALSQDAKYIVAGANNYDTAGDSDGAVYAFAPLK